MRRIMSHWLYSRRIMSVTMCKFRANCCLCAQELLCKFRAIAVSVLRSFCQVKMLCVTNHYQSVLAFSPGEESWGKYLRAEQYGRRWEQLRTSVVEGNCCYWQWGCRWRYQCFSFDLSYLFLSVLLCENVLKLKLVKVVALLSTHFAFSCGQ